MSKPISPILLSVLFASTLVPALAGAQVELDLFAPDRVAQVEVTMDPEDWHALRISHRSREEGNWSKMADNPYLYYPAKVKIDGREFESVGIRKKGFIGSAISTRPSLKIKLNKYVKGQEIDGMDLLTFNNNNQDPTQAQQFLVYDLMNQAGAMAPRVGFAHITVNGEDLGVYSHVEAIRKPFIKRRLGKSNGNLYEGMAGDFDPRAFPRIVHKWGKDEGMQGLLELKDLIEAPGPIDVSKLAARLDLDSFVTLWVAEGLVGH
jgi:spore coat protein CotH